MSAVKMLAYNCLLLLLLCVTLPVVSVGLVVMVLMCQSYTCYLCIKNLPVLIFTTPVFPITGILLLLYSRRGRNTRLGKWYLDKTSAITQLAFGSFLKKKRNPSNNELKEEEKMVFTIFAHEANLKEMRWLFIILVQATLLAFAQFWDKFLLEESHSCSTHPNIHCFSTTIFLPYGQRTNCSDTSDTGIHAIVCYQYVFNIGNAATSAIGIFSATGTIITIVGFVFIKLLNGIRSHKRLITCIKLLVAAEIVIFCQALYFLSMIDIIRGGLFAVLTLDYYATVRSFYKTLTMTIMIASSIISFPLNKFRKSGYQKLHEHVRDA